MAAIDKASKSLSALFAKGMQGTASSQEQLILVSRTLMGHLARPLIQQMGITGEATTEQQPITLLDSACGGGVVTQEVQAALGRDVLEKSRMVAADKSEMLVDLVKGRIVDEGWVNVEAKVLDAIDTGLPESTFSHVCIALGLHLIPQPDDVVKDCIRILKPNGILGFTTFQTGSPHHFWRPDMESAFASFPFDAPFPSLDELPMQMHSSGNWTDRAAVEAHLSSSPVFSNNLVNVEVKNIVGRWTVEKPEEWVLAFGSMLTWVTGTWWSEETRRMHPMEEVKGLIVEHLKDKYKGESWEVSWELVCATARVNK